MDRERVLRILSDALFLYRSLVKLPAFFLTTLPFKTSQKNGNQQPYLSGPVPVKNAMPS